MAGDKHGDTTVAKISGFKSHPESSQDIESEVRAVLERGFARHLSEKRVGHALEVATWSVLVALLVTHQMVSRSVSHKLACLLGTASSIVSRGQQTSY